MRFVEVSALTKSDECSSLSTIRNLLAFPHSPFRETLRQNTTFWLRVVNGEELVALNLPEKNLTGHQDRCAKLSAFHKFNRPPAVSLKIWETQ